MVRIAASLALALVLLGTGCARRDVETRRPGPLRVVATIGMIADVVQQVGGSRVEVTGLMGPGVDPHLYKASAGDVRRLAAADLVFYNGLHLEAAMGEVLEEMNRWRPTRAVTDGIDRQQLSSPPEFQGSYDPHVWFDVALWSRAASTIATTLGELDPAYAAEYRARAEAYRAELAELDAWVRERASEVPPERRVLVTAHDAFHYFGRAYGFEVRGLQGISTASEAGTADMQRLADEITRRRIPAIFVETSIPRRTVEALQAAVRARGFQVRIGGSLFSDAMGDGGTPEGTYVGMVRHNVNTIVDALSAPVVAERRAERGRRRG
ncbi:MAG TPA: zinc ABC transporter substrate-binding protein [Longimicrobiales bacterium]|nr:zinc ABC transporter substrate-binding protein [Longimicrobiales bacterium]